MDSFVVPRLWSSAQHEALLALCRQYHVARLWLFGSAVTEHFDPARSDFDFVVERQPELEAQQPRLLHFQLQLEDLFGRAVDLVTVLPIRNPYLRQEVEETQRLIYDAARQEIPV